MPKHHKEKHHEEHMHHEKEHKHHKHGSKVAIKAKMASKGHHEKKHSK